ncbi:hypothetical protein G8933_003445, partial [Salmonella enterica]|nr:hypothetical protein [Salmonella enterica]EEI8007197.1 hypothetical protein [Salmonella enterica]EHZ9301024.1 hypothetical protein [Salmonella enterica]
MSSKYEELKKEVSELADEGRNLYLSMLNEHHKFDDELLKDLHEKGSKIVDVGGNYQSWYSKACRVIEQTLPERLDEFVKLYKGDEKRKEISPLNYSISDYLVGIQSTRGSSIIASRKDAIPKMETQYRILSSAAEKFESSIFDIKEVLQADLFDTELDTAKELNKKGFVRAAGAVAGVVLEKHLSHVCNQHKLKLRKAHPTISDYYQTLKDSDIIDTPTWRFIQHLGDIRNLCDHNKDREPTKVDVSELITGIEKV